MALPKVIFMGSKPGSVVALEHILAKAWNVECVVVSKTVDYPWYGDNNLKTFAGKNRIPVFVQSEIPNATKVDYVISYMYRHLVKDRILSMASHASVNFHAAPLPEFGGWGTYNRAVLEDSSYFGCTCHHMAKAFDDGPIVAIRKFPINSSVLTAFDIEGLAQKEMIKLFADVVRLIEEDRKLPCFEQDKSKSRYLSFEEMEALKRIPENASADQVEKLARAFWFPPHKGAFFEAKGMEIEVVPKAVKDAWASEQGSVTYQAISKVMQDYSTTLL